MPAYSPTVNVLLATGIYPPAIGGPATYVRALARELHQRGIPVTVLAYGDPESVRRDAWPVHCVPYFGGPLLRWWRYSRALRQVGSDMDIVYAFSSVSCGVPLFLARLKKPKILLRIGGDFCWERYTDRGGMLDLRAWYRTKRLCYRTMQWVLRLFHHLVFSTAFQRDLYEGIYNQLPARSVIENALPSGTPIQHTKHEPFRLLFMGRFVGFKNIPNLLLALVKMPGVHLTLVGSGPTEKSILQLIEELLLTQRVRVLPTLSGEKKDDALRNHDLLVLPSLTEISPNMALEARVAGLPVLLSEETGLQGELASGMTIKKLRDPVDIVRALADAISNYESLATAAAAPVPARTWTQVGDEHLELFRQLLA